MNRTVAKLKNVVRSQALVALLVVGVGAAGVAVHAPEANACINGVKRHVKQRQRLVQRMHRTLVTGDYKATVRLGQQIAGKRIRKPKDAEDRAAAESVSIAVIRMNAEDRQKNGAIQDMFRTSKQALHWAENTIKWAAKSDKNPRAQARAAEVMLQSEAHRAKGLKKLEELHAKGLIGEAATYKAWADAITDKDPQHQTLIGECQNLDESGAICGGTPKTPVDVKKPRPKSLLRRWM